jgi:hypothetical protein
MAEIPVENSPSIMVELRWWQMQCQHGGRQTTKSERFSVVSRRGRLLHGSRFRRCRQHPQGGPAPKGQSKRPPGWPSTRGGTGPKPLRRHEKPAVRARMSTGRPPTEFAFSPMSTASLWPVGSERPAEKAPGMAEHEGGDRAETAARPQKTSKAGPYLDGKATRRVRVFVYVDSTPVAARQRKAGRKGPRDGRARGGEPGQNGCTATKNQQGGPVSRRGGLQQSSSFLRSR